MRSLLPSILLVLAGFAAGASPRDASTVRAEYVEVWTRLVAAKVDVGETEAAVRASGDLRQAWELMGEWLVAALRRRPSATAEDLRAELRTLNPEDTRAACKSSSEDEVEHYMDEFFCSLARFVIDADVLEIEPTPRSVFAVAVRYSYFGRLLLVSPDGLAASEEIERCSILRRLPSTAAGKPRFYAYSRCDDWPTSCCGGGELSVWTWDGRAAIAGARGSFGAPRPGCGPPRDGNLYVRGRWLKLYAQGDMRTFSESCAGGIVESIWKIRLDEDGVRDFGQQLVVAEYGVADRLIARVLHGGNAEKLATVDAVQSLRALLAGRRRWLGLGGGHRLERTPLGTRFVLATDEASLVFTIERRHKRPFVVAVEASSPADLAALRRDRARSR